MNISLFTRLLLVNKFCQNTSHKHSVGVHELQATEQEMTQKTIGHKHANNLISYAGHNMI